MKLIVGLGNPGKEYENTRHNAGFMVVNALADIQESKPNWKSDKKHHSEILETTLSGKKVLLVMPQTYMNNSGQAVSALLSYYKLDTSELIVIYDDFDRPLGTIRVRTSGSSGGHNGMQSIIDTFKTEDIARIRLGIGNVNDPDFTEKRIPREDYVLLPFKSEEKEEFEKSVNKAVNITKEIVSEGLNSLITNHES